MSNIYEESSREAWRAIISKVQELEANGMSRAEISRMLGHSGRSAVTSWLKEPEECRVLSFQDILKYFAVLDINIRDFLPPPPPTIKRVETYAPAEAVQGQNLPTVPILMEAGAGPDIEVFSGDVGDTIPILPAYWRPDMWAVRIKGDSMEPLIMSGACVGVVPLDGDFIEGGLYLVRMPHFGYVVKRVRMGEDGIVLLSENPRIPPRHVPFEGHENIIAGRVVWFWQMCE